MKQDIFCIETFLSLFLSFSFFSALARSVLLGSFQHIAINLARDVFVLNVNICFPLKAFRALTQLPDLIRTCQERNAFFHLGNEFATRCTGNAAFTMPQVPRQWRRDRLQITPIKTPPAAAGIQFMLIEINADIINWLPDLHHLNPR